LSATHADVFKSHGAQAVGVEQIFCVDYEGPLQQVLDAVKVETTELGPSSADD
jgi:hypothetical protein